MLSDPSPPLTPRELAVLRLLARGVRSREIAVQLVISWGTVTTDGRRICQKLRVPDEAAAIERAMTLGLLPRDSTRDH